MSKVTRYGLVYGFEVPKDVNGRYVTHEDYQKLEQQRDKLLEGVKESKASFDELFVAHDLDELIKECEANDG